MSEYNGNFYNNQTPPDNGNRPDYSYNWNGTEHNNGNKGNKGRAYAIIAVVACLFTAITFSVIMIMEGIGSYVDESEEEIVSSSSTEISAEISEDDTSLGNTHYEGFAPAEDAYVDLSTTLTKIYAECAPSCCTIKVSSSSHSAIGSGFVYDDENGYIVTNHHVIENATKISVKFYNGEEYSAKLINSDSVTDLAVLQIKAEGLKALEMGDSSVKKIGENVVAIGSPYSESLAGSMTCGIISGVARTIDIHNDSGKVIKTMTLIQTDCSINPGNSGGPLIDMAGNVIGITSLKLVDEQLEGIGFAIPITEASQIINKLISGEDIGDSGFASASPRIGVTIIEVDNGLSSLRIRPKCDYPESVIVMSVDATSSAYSAGLRQYDLMTDFNGIEVKTVEDLASALEKHKAGNTVTVTIFRFNNSWSGGETKTITFKLDAAS
jgi:serine protease Do